MLFVVIAVWLAIGAVAVAVMHRRGHDTFAWAVLFLFMGPLALPLALSSERHRPPEPEAPTNDGCLDVLIAHDGSADAATAARAAFDLLGAQMTSLTFAAVLDVEAASTVRGRDDQQKAQARLDDLARDAAAVTGLAVESVILFGEPIEVLQHFAAAHGYDLIVAGGHVGGRSHRAAWKLATRSPVPVLLGPARA